MAAALGSAPAAVSAQAPQAPTPLQQNPASLFITRDNVRFQNYLRDLAGPRAFVHVIGSGVVDHLRAQPEVGTDGTEDLAQRIASKAGQAAVRVSVRHGLAALMQRSTEYQPCECRGFGPRIEHALIETFTDRRSDGSRALSVPRIAGTYAGGLSQLAWDRDRSLGDVALSATLSFGLTAVFNVARELTGLRR